MTLAAPKWALALGAKLLPDQWNQFLSVLPESGMGYQTGDVILRGGKIIQDVVFSSGYVMAVRNYLRIPFDPEDIDKIILTHRKW